MNSLTAGKGTPYWYEWSVGLLKVVEMLYPESGIVSVSFQESGVKGWDDVVVRYADGRTEYIQVKHSREGTNITFGSFLTADEDAGCLLESLYAAWLQMGLSPHSASCIVFTNREAGERTYEGRPPLVKFISWLNVEKGKRGALADFAIPKEWEDAWNEWLGKLKAGTDDQRLDFLRAFTVETNQPDLEKLQTQIQERLAEAFGISVAKAAPLLHALSDALKRWTDWHERVTTEHVFDALVLPGDLEIYHPAPPPPAPFFPTREAEARSIEDALASNDGPPVLFLSAAPGAGKTSVLSRIELRRTDKPLSGIVGLRYFAFQPITPESPLIPADADYYVKAERLWLSLLSQFRRELHGRLAKYKVPIRNNFLTWQDARAHVMRLADQIGTELGRRFVLAIDGIDHAARAGRARYDQGMARDFFASLPGPDELRTKQIRLFVAGQPAEHYPEYPLWLRAIGADVQTLRLGALGKGDIASLIRTISLKMPHEQWDRAIEIVANAAQGNTLAIVFAAEEAKICTTAEELDARLRSRLLHQGLGSYYESIWRYAFTNVPNGNNEIGVEAALAGALSLLRERATGELLASAFSALGLTNGQWHLLLANLGPLIVEEGNGFRVLHNDVRVFLTGYLSARADAEKKWIYSALADYYIRPSCDRRAAHVSLLSLLRGAGREREWARVFTVDWVFEAAAYDIPFGDVWPECLVAVREGAELRDWDVMHELACATETLGRWQDRNEASSSTSQEKHGSSAPFFPPSELAVTPFDSWALSDLQQVARDVERILDGNELLRAKALLERWFQGLTLSALGEHFFDEEDEQKHRDVRHGPSVGDVFVSLGAVCREAEYDFVRGKNSSKRHNKAHFYFERGWTERSCVTGPFQSLGRCFLGRLPCSKDGCARAIRELAGDEHWRLVGRLLRLSHDRRSQFSEQFQLLAPWWCLRAGAQKWCPDWLEGLKARRIEFRTDYQDNLKIPLAICRARGWLEPTTHPGTIAQDVLKKASHINRGNQSASNYLLLFRTAAVLGRFTSLQVRGKLDAARDLFRPSELRDLVTALWGDGLAHDADFHWNHSVAGRLATELVQAFFQLGGEHAATLLEVGRPIAERWWGGYRFESLWELFRLAGERSLLQTWINKILGPSGWAWEDSADSRESSVEEYLPFARQIGEDALANQAENRVRWFRISYRGHKDYSFDCPSKWFREFARIDSTAMRTHGFRFLTLCEACSAQGDNREQWDVNTIVGAAAIAAGPDDVYRLLWAEQPSQGTCKWLPQASARFVNGLTDYLSRSNALLINDKIICWCLAVGMSRWFDNNDVSALAKLRKTLLESLPSQDERVHAEATIALLTPGEAVRQPVQSDSVPHEPKRAPEDFDNWKTHLTNGLRLPPKEALHAISGLNAVESAETRDVIVQILESVGTNDSYSGAWDHYAEETPASLKSIAKIVSDSSMWSLVKAAISAAGNTGYWWTTVSANLQAVILARSLAQGSATVSSGLTRVLDMHERWARGGDRSLPLAEVKPGTGDNVATWSELSARMFTLLLSSRYSTVIEAACTGLHALTCHQPETIQLVFRFAEGDPWRMQWLLTLAEVWALKFPDQFKTVTVHLERMRQNEPLRLRVQAWLVSVLLAERNGSPWPPLVFHDKLKPRQIPASRIPPDILYTEADSRGSFRLVDRYESARSTIERVEAATEFDLTEVKSRVAHELLQHEELAAEQRPWEQRIRNWEDSFSRGEASGAALDQVFDAAFSHGTLSEEEILIFAQAYLHSEDGWVLRHTPRQHSNSEVWPNSDALAGEYSAPPSSRTVQDQFRSLVCEKGIAADEVVIGARMQAFSWREDFGYWCWWQEGRPSENETMPTTLSGRTFPWLLNPNWWEPNWDVGRRPVCFMTGGQQYLLRCAPEVVPAHIWTTLFGWMPSAEEPFCWNCDNKLVARFEIVHGPLNYSRSHHARQPTLHRWIVKKTAWQEIFPKMTNLQWRERFQRVSSNAEK
jgi:hypothetical protein